MGHGPDEAALGVHLRVAWRALVLAGVPDDHILVALSRLLEAESAGGIFVTVCDLTIDRDLGLTVRVAGHPPPLLCADGRAPATSTSRSARRSGSATSSRSGSWPVTRTQLAPGAVADPLHRRSPRRLPAGRQPDQRRARRAARGRHRRAVDGRAARRACSRPSWRGRPCGPSTTPRSWCSGGRPARRAGRDVSAAGLEPAPPGQPRDRRRAGRCCWC